MKEVIDEYKHLDRLCGRIYGKKHGVSQYISDMEDTPLYISRSITGWKSDLKNLKRLRQMRNVRNRNSARGAAFTKEDLEYLNVFYHRILNHQDPLSKKRSLCKNSREVHKRYLLEKKHQIAALLWKSKNRISKMRNRKIRDSLAYWGPIAFATITLALGYFIGRGQF